MRAHGRGRGSGAIFSRKKGTEIFMRFLRAVLKSCPLNPSYRPRDDKEERGAPALEVPHARQRVLVALYRCAWPRLGPRLCLLRGLNMC